MQSWKDKRQGDHCHSWTMMSWHLSCSQPTFQVWSSPGPPSESQFPTDVTHVVALRATTVETRKKDPWRLLMLICMYGNSGWLFMLHKTETAST